MTEVALNGVVYHQHPVTGLWWVEIEGKPWLASRRPGYGRDMRRYTRTREAMQKALAGAQPWELP